MAWLRRHLAEIHAYTGLVFLSVGAGWFFLPLGLCVAGAGLLYLAHRVAPPDEMADSTVTDTTIQRVA